MVLLGAVVAAILHRAVYRSLEAECDRNIDGAGAYVQRVQHQPRRLQPAMGYHDDLAGIQQGFEHSIACRADICDFRHNRRRCGDCHRDCADYSDVQALQVGRYGIDKPSQVVSEVAFAPCERFTGKQGIIKPDLGLRWTSLYIQKITLS